MNSNERLVRINKFLSEAGVCSRKQADRLIEQGEVSVNGATAFLGMKICDGDHIMVGGVPIESKPDPIYLLYHKPVGITCTHDLSVADNLVEAVDFPQRVFAVGRLDKASEGLMLLTNDGEIVNRVLRAENAHQKVYAVTVDKPVTQEFLQTMSSGVAILDTVTRPCQVSRLGENRFEIILTQGLNRQIRRMCKTLRYRVTRLQRQRIMHLELGDLQEGQWRFLTEEEKGTLIGQLRDSSSLATAD
ncbi:pseudouridine synthase [Thiomicrorhabdus sp. ZW0627]|uniref:pseudouridine synthase n=1 Tax=Thiomicrorhabdus sp. ZW0627 TaxID=3039774 RepID=UPI0024364002|nr:pseudouridine synthase [Thiomicrorhabdus sp. ZW0627]MDG6773515.1 pseudouridine synthase [Thiomicrorhabdus sp. ZW0627]